MNNNERSATAVAHISSPITHPALLEAFKNYIRSNHLFHVTDRLLLTVSGGVDSVVLSDLCFQAGYDFEIAHCNFGLRGDESERDENFVKALAARYHKKIHVRRFETARFAGEQRVAVEEAARTLRYQWFHELLAAPAADPLRYIVTGHHSDDNIETMLMCFFRGTGLHGLAGIAAANGYVIRPLLFASRVEIVEYAKTHQLDFVEDSSNADNQYTRNYFRNQLIPSVQKVFPAVEQNLVGNLQRFREADQLYQQAIARHKKKLLTHYQHEIHIPVRKLRCATPLYSIVYEILKDYGFSSAQIPDAISLLQSESGRYVCSATHRLLRNREWLILAPLQTGEATHILIEGIPDTISFPGGKLKMETLDKDRWKLSSDQVVAQLDMKKITFPLLLRPWKQGDYFYPLGMRKKKKLSRFLTDLKFSVPEKERTWVLESGRRIVWVVGHRIDDRFKITAETRQVLRINLRGQK